mgnify:CR=1 FL=1
MTDDEAKDDIDDILSAHAGCGGCPTCQQMRHSRRAIEDRAALVKTFEDYRFGDVPDAIDAARRHMRGEE